MIEEDEYYEVYDNRNISDELVNPFEEADKSVIWEDFLPTSKRIVWLPGRDKKINDILNIDFSQLWKNLKHISDSFDNFISTEWNIADAIYKLEKELGEFLLFEVPDINLWLTKKCSGLSVYATKFQVKEGSKLYFNLKIKNKKESANISIKTIMRLIGENANISIHKSLKEKYITINEIPCNEPIVTEYISYIFDIYKQLILFTLHNYKFKWGLFNKRIFRKNIGHNELYENTLENYLIKDCPEFKIIKNQYRYNLWENSYFSLDFSDDNYVIINFKNASFESAEYWYQKLVEAMDKVESIASKKVDLIKILDSTKKELSVALSKDKPSIAEKKEIIENMIEGFENYKKEWDYVESDIYITFLKDILKNIDYLDFNDLKGISKLWKNKFKVISNYYYKLIKSIISESNFFLFNKIYKTKKEQEEYIFYILNLLQEISGFEFFEDYIQGIINLFNKINYEYINNPQYYLSIWLTIIKWAKENKQEQILDSFYNSFVRYLVYKKDFSLIWEEISDNKDVNIKNIIDNCLEKYKSFLDKNIIQYIEQILYTYSLESVISHHKELLEKWDIDLINLDLFDQFTNKKVLLDRNNSFKSIVNNLFSPEELELKFVSIDTDSLKKDIIKDYYNLFYNQYIKTDMAEDLVNKFSPYFTEKQINSLKKWKTTYLFGNLTQYKGIIDNSFFEKYKQYIEEIPSYYSPEETKKYQDKFKKFLINYIKRNYINKLRKNKTVLIDEEQMKQIFSYLSEERIKQIRDDIEFVSVEKLLKKDIQEAVKWKKDIDLDKYKAYDMSKWLESFLKLIKLRHKNIINKIKEDIEGNFDLDNEIKWYNKCKEDFPFLSEHINIDELVDNMVFTRFKKSLSNKISQLQDENIDIDLKEYQWYNYPSLLEEVKNIIRLKHNYNRDTIRHDWLDSLEEKIKWYKECKKDFPILSKTLDAFIQELNNYRYGKYLDKDIKNLKYWDTNIDIDKYIWYKSYNTNEKFIEMIFLKYENDKNEITKNYWKNIDLDEKIKWYNKCKEKFPNIIWESIFWREELEFDESWEIYYRTLDIDKMIWTIQKLAKKWTGSELIKAFQQVENKIFPNETDLEKLLEEINYYINNPDLDKDEDVPSSIKDILKDSINILLTQAITEDKQISEIKNIIIFLKNLNIPSNYRLFLEKIEELEKFYKLFTTKDLKYIHVLIWIINDILSIKDKENLKEQKENISKLLIKQLIKLIDKLEKKDAISYSKSRELVNRIRLWKIRKIIKDIWWFEDSKFVMMLNHF